MLEEFKKFAMRGNVIDLAVGVIHPMTCVRIPSTEQGILDVLTGNTRPETGMRIEPVG